MLHPLQPSASKVASSRELPCWHEEYNMEKQQNTSNQQQSAKPGQPSNPMSGKPAQSTPTPQRGSQPAQTGTGNKK
jgi:hypothetical protein